jgi:regulator of sigma E protease
LRDDKKVAFTVTPKEWKIGTYVGYHIVSNDDTFKYQYPFPEAIKEGFKEMFSQSRLTFSFLGDLVKKLVAPKNAWERKEATESLSGPVGVGSMFVWLVSANVTASVIFLVMAVISINLWVFNLLPFPALDGGRFFFMALDAFFVRFFGKKSSHGRIEHIAHLVGFVILIGLSIFVAYQDIARLFQ